LSFTSPINLTGEIIMNRQNYLEAIETVLAWDLSEEALTNAIHQQVRLMQDINQDDNWELNFDYEYFH